MATIRCYRDLEVWQKGMDLVVDIYRETASFPRHEQFGLINQMCRAAAAVPTNIAEGHSRDHRKEYLYFISIAYASLMELETQIQIAERLAYLPPEKVEHLLKKAGELGRMLNGLRKALTQNG